MIGEASHRGTYHTKAAGDSESATRAWVRAWRGRCSYKLGLLFSVLRLARSVVQADWPGAPLSVQADRMRLRMAVEKAWPLVSDTDGKAWE